MADRTCELENVALPLRLRLSEAVPEGVPVSGRVPGLAVREDQEEVAEPERVSE